MKQFFKYVLATVVGIILTSFLSLIFFIFIISAFVSSINKNESVMVEDKSILYVDLNQPIIERSLDNHFDLDYLMGVEADKIGFFDLINGIKKAETDDRIKGIYINVSAPQSGMATMKEVRQALIEFKKSGKPIIAYSEVYSQGAYYLASVANKVYLNPQGDLEFKGLNSEVMFFKGALDKIGVEMQILRVGDFKSAVEPYTNTKMSEPNRLQVSQMVNGIYDEIIKEIGSSRNISTDSLKSIANQYKIQQPEDALKYKMVDALKYKDEVLEELNTITNTKKNKNFPIVSINDYIKNKVETDISNKNKVAVIYANGEITGGEGDDATIGSERISRAIRKARIDSTIKAIVLRVNSPGGSALASEVIWREVSLTKKVKPVIASFGDVAASGGYYIAAGADSILVQPNTITGSIGVFGIIPNAQKLLNDKIGITFDNEKTGQFADIMSLTRPMTPGERFILQNGINRVYNVFINRVSTGRTRSKEYIETIASGRVWTGKDAVRIGLADREAGFKEAIESAARKANIKNYRLVEYPEKLDPIKALLNNSKNNIQTYFLQRELGNEYSIYKKIKEASQRSGIQTHMMFVPVIY
ncbi:signal peptide peptidase SppA [Pedobacter flavus]|uniref:Signal peptide peptidase SppA n=1 Tax=Pedobacter flavus TaxID=3113906 RepID=A0ABU7H3I3_9SPHI|nr:signal peptide peptidase SppA [Pedobacter sp. VNH31]MEE1885890.1 signal peptide peptidase SppA [Pedobacter sp. VNH31]